MRPWDKNSASMTYVSCKLSKAEYLPLCKRDDSGHGQYPWLIKTFASVPGHRGKPSYMAPEMFSQRSYDARAADVFSCGVCAYALAMGSYPWSSTRRASPSHTLTQNPLHRTHNTHTHTHTPYTTHEQPNAQRANT